MPKPNATITLTFVVPLDINQNWAEQLAEALRQIQAVNIRSRDVALQLPDEVFATTIGA